MIAAVTVLLCLILFERNFFLILKFVGNQVAFIAACLPHIYISLLIVFICFDSCFNVLHVTLYGNEKGATLPAEEQLNYIVPFGLPFDTYELRTVITEHEIVIGDQ